MSTKPKMWFSASVISIELPISLPRPMKAANSTSKSSFLLGPETTTPLTENWARGRRRSVPETTTEEPRPLYAIGRLKKEEHICSIVVPDLSMRAHYFQNPSQ